MLDSWNRSIFMNVKDRLQESAMKLIQAERNGEAFDSQLVIGVRESYVNLCSNNDDKLEIYRSNFENAYLQATSELNSLTFSILIQKLFFLKVNFIICVAMNICKPMAFKVLCDMLI